MMSRLLLLVALRLDAAERAAQLLYLAFVGELLALGNLDELENLVHLVVQFFQRRGDEHGVLDGLTDGRGRCRPKVCWLDPLFLARRLGLTFTVLRTLLAARFARHFTLTWRFRCGSRYGFSDRSFDWRLGFVSLGRWRDFMRTEAFRSFGMRFAEPAFGLGFMFGVRRNLFGGGSSRLGNRFRLSGCVCGGGSFGFRFGGSGARAATAAATTPASAAAVAGSTRWIQIGFFVRHKFVP